MSVSSGYQPASVLRFFEEICAIPHGSGHTKAISDYLVGFAKEHALKVRQDALNNVVLFAPASAGYEASAPVILQGHMDMVCEKAPDCTKDMEKEGLDLCVENGKLFARGTTLGGDDGIAVAMALAVLDDPAIPHPPLEVIVTVDEEIGMLGAEGLDVSDLKGRMLINIDSEDEGVLTVSCAGGNRTSIHMPVARSYFRGTLGRIVVRGCQGGHSGVEIDKGRGNAVLLLGRVLTSLWETTEQYRIVGLYGGGKDNAIPTEAYADLRLGDDTDIAAFCRKYTEIFRKEYRQTDPNISVVWESSDTEEEPFGETTHKRALTLLSCVPNGIQEMSADIPGLVQTSLNLGILDTREDELYASFCLRSSLSTQKEMMVSRLRALASQLHGTISIVGDYPAWEYQPESRLRDTMVSVFEQQYGKQPEVVAIHAGLECGLFCGKIPGLDCVSFGPDLKDIHTFKESLSLDSAERTWNYLLGILKELK